MSISVIQANSAFYEGSGTEVSTTLPNVAAGNAIFVAVSWYGGRGNPAAVVVRDNHSGTGTFSGAANVYPVTITAKNDAGSVQQTFLITIG